MGCLWGGGHRKALACGCCSYDQGRSKINQKCRRGGQIVMHRRQCGVGGLSGTTFPTGKSPLYGETFRAVLVAYKQHGRGRACRESASRTNLWVSSPAPLTGLWQPAGAAGGGTAPMSRTGRRSAARGLSPELSRWAEPPLPDAGRAPIQKFRPSRSVF